MRSRFFTDTQGLDAPAEDPDTLSVCLRISRQAYERAVRQAALLGLSCGAYLELLLSREPGD